MSINKQIYITLILIETLNNSEITGVLVIIKNTKQEHEYATTTLALSQLPEICANVAQRLDEEMRLTTKQVVNILHAPPVPMQKVE